MTVVTGVSGSGKSTLVSKIIYPALGNQLGLLIEDTGKYDGLAGDFEQLEHIAFVDQNPIGKSSRSNPITYVKAYDAIRQLLAAQPLAQQRGYKPSQFSFNTEGGRCEACQGEGETRIAMQFMAATATDDAAAEGCYSVPASKCACHGVRVCRRF